MKVFVVTSGTYSDYSIDRIFSTRELADDFVTHDDDARVEEWEVDGRRVQFGEQFLIQWVANGDQEWSSGPEWVEGYERDVTVDEWDGPQGHVIRVWAPTAEHAAKVLGERKALHLEHA